MLKNLSKIYQGKVGKMYELTYPEPTKRNETNSINLVGLQLTKDPVPVDRSVSTIQDTTDSGFWHTKLTSEKNSRNVKEITCPSRKSVLDKEPRSIYQNNSPLCRNSIQQVHLTSPQPTSPGHTSYKTWPSQYSGNVVPNQKMPSTPPSHYSGNVVQNQKIPSTPPSYIGHSNMYHLAKTTDERP